MDKELGLGAKGCKALEKQSRIVLSYTLGFILCSWYLVKAN